MDGHKISALNRLEVVETGRRRRWSDEEKERIILESMAGPRIVAATARRHGISRSLLSTWRRVRGVGPDNVTGFVPAVVEPDDGPVAPALTAPGLAASLPESPDIGERRIEIALTCGRRIFVDPSVDIEALGRIVTVLDRK